MSIRQAFEKKFGVEDATAIVAAAVQHKNGVHDKMGSDPFKWALCICIGYECMSQPRYRKEHGIKTPWRTLKAWIKKEANLKTHDGDVDYLGLFAGAYKDFA